MIEWLEVFIVALLPLTALFTVLQRQPYFALISRGLMGMIAVMLYAVMGAADVALTEALVGTLLTVILFAIAVRSSMVLRVGVSEGREGNCGAEIFSAFCRRHRLYTRRVVFSSDKDLIQALKAGRVDAVGLETDLIQKLSRYLPEMDEGAPPAVVLAEHCRWHERKMNEMGSAAPIARLNYLGLGGGK